MSPYVVLGLVWTSMLLLIVIGCVRGGLSRHGAASNSTATGFSDGGGGGGGFCGGGGGCDGGGCS